MQVSLGSAIVLKMLTVEFSKVLPQSKDKLFKTIIRPVDVAITKAS